MNYKTLAKKYIEKLDILNGGHPTPDNIWVKYHLYYV